jgi:hypothetical protein
MTDFQICVAAVWLETQMHMLLSEGNCRPRGPPRVAGRGGGVRWVRQLPGQLKYKKVARCQPRLEDVSLGISTADKLVMAMGSRPKPFVTSPNHTAGIEQP